MADILFELTEEHLDEGLQSIPVGFVHTSHVDPELGLMYFNRPVLEYLNYSIDDLTVKFLGQIPLAILSDETKVLISQIDRGRPPLEQIQEALSVLKMTAYVEERKEQVLQIVGVMKEIVETLFGPIPIDPTFFLLHMDEGGGAIPPFLAKALLSIHHDAYSALSVALIAMNAPRQNREWIEAVRFLQELDMSEIEFTIEYTKKVQGYIPGYDVIPFKAEDRRATFFFDFLKERFHDEPLVQKALLLRKVMREKAHSSASSALYLFLRGYEEVHLYPIVLLLSRLIGVAAQMIDEIEKKTPEMCPLYFYKEKRES